MTAFLLSVGIAPADFSLLLWGILSACAGWQLRAWAEERAYRRRVEAWGRGESIK